MACTAFHSQLSFVCFETTFPEFLGWAGQHSGNCNPYASILEGFRFGKDDIPHIIFRIQSKEF